LTAGGGYFPFRSTTISLQILHQQDTAYAAGLPGITVYLSQRGRQRATRRNNALAVFAAFCDPRRPPPNANHAFTVSLEKRE